MNFKKIKTDFPIFGEKGVPKELVYLDSAATSQKPRQVIDTIIDFYRNHNANVYRGIHSLSEQATIMYENARTMVGQFINTKDSSEVIFTKGATESINFVADTWVRNNLKPGDEILITQAEHHSNFLPWQRLAQELGVVIKYITVNPYSFTFGCQNKQHFNKEKVGVYGGSSEEVDSCMDPDCRFWDDLVTDKTKFMAVTLDSNVIGPVWGENFDKLFELIKKVHSVGGKVLLDAAQLIAHQRVDVQKLDCDFLAFSGHKILGPTGIGVLFIKKSLHDEVSVYQVGGSMVQSVSFDRFIWKPAPYKFEAGTPPIAQAIGLGAAVDYLSKNVNFSELKIHEASLCSNLIERLKTLDNVSILGNIELLSKEGHLVTFEVTDVHAHDISAYLDMRGIVTRAGHHCAQPLAHVLGVDSSLRVSFYLYNTVEDIDLFFDSLVEAIKQFKHE